MRLSQELMRLRGIQSSSSQNSSVSYIQSIVDSYNNHREEPNGYDCPKCNNNQWIAVVVDEDTEAYKPCECQQIRRIMKLEDKSGIKDLLARYTFDSYEDNTGLLKQAKQFAEADKGWMFIGGKVGSGKTHLATAIVGTLLKRGVPCRYMLWRNDSRDLKARVNDESYNEKIFDFCNVEVLYIDDLLKGSQTQADLNILYEIVNERYAKELRTIFTSEMSIEQLMQIDEAIASRIIQMCEGNVYYLKSPNRRLE